ncbi:MAG: DNA polymerase Y family protein [Alphaproteobacteria bacterium]|nr:DNA polymerase Y family protein [Alphaproteobacteria bacterium]
MSAASPNARWLAIYLPRIRTDRLIRAGRGPSDGRPLAVYSKENGALQLKGIDARASALGLTLAMSLADARAIQPKLEAVEADIEEDTRALGNIAAWCERFTPIVVLDPPEGLFLDITGCAHLFGGEENLCAEIVTRLHAQGYSSRAAIAPTPGAAWAFSRYRKPIGKPATLRESLQASLEQPEGWKADLAALPVEALRLDPDAATLLRRLGLKAIGQIQHAPRSAFAARAGERAMLRLDQALGRAQEALTPRRPAPPVFALRRFLEPIFTADAVLQVTQDLCGDLIEKLDIRGAGVLRAELVLFGVDGRDRVIDVNVSKPLRDVKPLMRLFREKLNIVSENLDAQFGFEAARVNVVRLAELNERTRTLVSVDANSASAETISSIADILTSRLGAKRVVRPQIHEEHVPERAAGWRSVLSEKEAKSVKPPADGVQRRPVRLFSPGQQIEVMAGVPDGPPIRFRWRRVMREVVCAEGPERISGDWQKREKTRDYYRVEDKQGRRYWLYREGLYGENEVSPRWYLHGLFA